MKHLDGVQIDAVVIGRNEGARLTRCLLSLQGQVRRVVYVDSGSSDGSVEVARGLGAQVVALDMTQPFTAARARNAGLAVVQRPDFVQFVDGDCEVVKGWLAEAASALESDEKLAVVTGWRSEIRPHDSVYNAICDDEWHAPAGPITACGGDMMVRRAAYDQVGGFNEMVIAAEDDEFCIRVGAAGWQLLRLPSDMTRHDAAMHTFGQWWKRAVRAGHGFGQVGDMHEGYFAAPRRRILIYAVMFPALLVAGLLLWRPLALAVLTIYAASFARAALRFFKGGKGAGEAMHHALLLVLSKFPNLIGFIQYYIRKRRGAQMRIIEYK